MQNILIIFVLIVSQAQSAGIRGSANEFSDLLDCEAENARRVLEAHNKLQNLMCGFIKYVDYLAEKNLEFEDLFSLQAGSERFKNYMHCFQSLNKDAQFCKIFFQQCVAEGDKHFRALFHLSTCVKQCDDVREGVLQMHSIDQSTDLQDVPWISLRDALSNLYKWFSRCRYLHEWQKKVLISLGGGLHMPNQGCNAIVIVEGSDKTYQSYIKYTETRESFMEKFQDKFVSNFIASSFDQTFFSDVEREISTAQRVRVWKKRLSHIKVMLLGKICILIPQVSRTV
ncbi:MAG: hypothetical protein OXC30_01005 [Alphaproteobacteria bacterium]|nr:hypothetical protein [Alphaproteobacteria bacterium]